MMRRTKAPYDEGAVSEADWGRENLLDLLPLSQKSKIFDSSPDKGSL